MGLAKTGEIQKMCEPNALMTLMEYALDYGDESTCKKAEKLVMKEAEKINNEAINNNIIHFTFSFSNIALIFDIIFSFFYFINYINYKNN